MIVNSNSTYDNSQDFTQETVEDSIQSEDSDVITQTVPEESGTSQSEVSNADGYGGFDNNAYGYFSRFANTYIQKGIGIDGEERREVYFDGWFHDDKGSYPIELTFDIDENWNPVIGHYRNVEYKTELKMSVRFTEEQMIISGNAGGSQFTMRFTPTSDGRWDGTAQNGKHLLKAHIYPVETRK